MKILSCLFSLCIITYSAFANISSTDDASVWSTFQGNPAHTGFVPLTFDPSNFHLLWHRQLFKQPKIPPLNSPSINPPVTTNQSLYITTNCYSCQYNDLFDLSADTGEIKWHKSLGMNINVDAPTYANNRIYFQVTSTTPGMSLRAYDAETGHIIYRAPFASQGGSYSAPTVYDGQVYILDGTYGGIASYYEDDGLPNWFIPYASNSDKWSVSADDDYVVIHNSNDEGINYLVAFNPFTGKAFPLIMDPHDNGNGGGYFLAVALDKTRQFAFTTFTGYLTAYDLQTQKVAYSTGTSFTGQPDLANGIIYAKYENNNIVAIDEQTGKRKWAWSISSDQLPVTTAFIVTNNLLFVSGKKATYAISLSTHKTVWSYPVSGQLAINQDKLFIANKDSTIYAISLV